MSDLKHSKRRSTWLSGTGVVITSLGLFFATTAFRCPGPAPATETTGGAGGAGTGTSTATTTSSIGGAGGMGSSSSGPCSPDVMFDAANCGACGRACSPLGTMTVSCTMGICTSTCAPGRLNLVAPPAPIPDDGCETPIHRVFVTADPVAPNMNGNLGALGGDTVCETAASAAGLVTATSWRAWLSDTSSSPATHFNIDNGVYMLLDGTMVAAAWGDLIDGTLNHPIDLDEAGNSMLSVDVWTGTAIDGTLTTALNPFGTMVATECVNWSVTGSDVDYALLGKSSQADALWTANTPTQGCFVQGAHLYCFEQ